MHRILFVLLSLLAALGALAAGRLTGSMIPLNGVTPIRDQADPAYRVMRAAVRPVIDGRTDEWQQVPAMTLDNEKQVRGWHGLADLYGSMRVQWDDNGLYFCLEVADDVHNAPNADKDWWENDGCQFAFDAYLNGPNGGYDTEEYSYMVCDSPQGPLMIGYHLPGQRSEVGKPLPDHPVKIGVNPDGARL